MATLIVFSLAYYKLRIFSDTSFYLLEMTRSDGFYIAHNRFIGALSQWLAVVLLKADAPLNAVAAAYSFCYSFMPVVMALLALHWLKKPLTALTIVLLFTLMNSMLFYYTVSELQMGLGLLALYDGILEYCSEQPRERKSAFIVSSVLLLPTIAFCHPMAMPVFGIWLLYRFARRDSDRHLVSLSMLLFGVSFLVKKLFYMNGYESAKALTWERIKPFGLNYFSGPLANSFYNYLLADGFLVLFLLAVTIGMFCYLRKWSMLIMMLLGIASLFVIVMIAFEEFDGSHIYDHYYEHYLQPTVLVLLWCFCFAVSMTRLNIQLIAGAVAVMLIISFAKINNHSEWHFARQDWQHKYLALMDKLGLKKAIVGRKWGPDGMWTGSFWSSSAETLILSSLSGPAQTKTLYMAWNIDDVKEPYNRPDQLITDGSSYDQATLPTHYYDLGNKPYVFLENIVQDSVLKNMRWR